MEELLPIQWTLASRQSDCKVDGKPIRISTQDQWIN